MAVNNNEYSEMVKKASPDSPLLSDCIKAFLFGGGICCFAQGLVELMMHFGIDFDSSKIYAMIIIIAITAVLTGLGVFDKIAKHAGAGTMVPITGFANSIVSPAIEFHAEGMILGTAAKMFSIAGPVIVFGCSSATVYGLIYYLIKTFF